MERNRILKFTSLKDNCSEFLGSGDSASSNEESLEFIPLVIIAPPIVLLFLKDYEVIDSSIAGSYVPLSTRQLDPYDSCVNGDQFWCYGVDRAESIDIESNFTPDECENLPASSTGKLHAESAEWQLRKATALHFAKTVWSSMGITDITNVKVVHCKQAYGVSLTISAGADCGTYKIVYSGDCRPSNNLINLGAGAAILIHEATFEDGMSAEAASKRHSTVSDAISVSKDMAAFRLILTHFSQRYPSMPPLPAPAAAAAAATAAGDGDANVIVAFDFMRISFKDLLWAPMITDAFAIAFPQCDDG
jgi:hypothetical protein